MPSKLPAMPNRRTFTASYKSKAGRGPVPTLDQMRSVVASYEDVDAGITGMTRSLDRRLLALNLQPFPPASQAHP